MSSKILKGLLIAIGAFLGIGLLLPGTSKFERSIEIAATPSVIYDQINELKNWMNWSPWAKLDPNAKWTYSPQTSGVGANYSWVGNSDVGEGKLTILEAKPNELTHCKMEFGKNGDAFADFKLSSKDSTSTKVVWVFTSDLGMSPIARWFGLAMEGFVGKDYEAGLVNLKDVCEGKK